MGPAGAGTASGNSSRAAGFPVAAGGDLPESLSGVAGSAARRPTAIGLRRAVRPATGHAGPAARVAGRTGYSPAAKTGAVTAAGRGSAFCADQRSAAGDRRDRGRHGPGSAHESAASRRRGRRQDGGGGGGDGDRRGRWHPGSADGADRDPGRTTFPGITGDAGGAGYFAAPPDGEHTDRRAGEDLYRAGRRQCRRGDRHARLDSGSSPVPQARPGGDRRTAPVWRGSAGSAARQGRQRWERSAPAL